MSRKMFPVNIYLQYQYPFSRKQDLYKLRFKLLVSWLILNAVNCNSLFLYVELFFFAI